MEPERDEVYERIPWETLEKKGADRQWIAYAVAGAIVLGALTYSFVRNQPAAPLAAPVPVDSTVPATAATANVGPTSNVDSTLPGVESPVVVAEADLYAVDPERLIDSAATHAEWLAVEFISVDGTEESHQLLSGLLPVGLPLPQAPEGTQVYVDWAGATSVVQTGPVSFDVEVVVRSLVSRDGAAFVRQPPYRVGVAIEIGEDGAPHVTRAPSIATADPGASIELSLGEVPPDVVANLDIDGDVVGGSQTADGDWDVVVMMTGVDGVARPTTVSR